MHGKVWILKDIFPECWAWDGRHRKEDGRPVFKKKGKETYAYREIYSLIRGKIPNRHILHHTCENPWCINPWHLEAILQGDHLKEHGNIGDWGQRDKTHCPAGHPYDDVNTYYWRNERRCRECSRAAKLRYRLRKEMKD